MNEQKTTQSPDVLDSAVHDLFRIGKEWARHGLSVGQSALETSASTLRTTADFLGRLSTSFDDGAINDETTTEGETETKQPTEES